MTPPDIDRKFDLSRNAKKRGNILAESYCRRNLSSPIAIPSSRPSLKPSFPLTHGRITFLESKIKQNSKQNANKRWRCGETLRSGNTWMEIRRG